MPQQPFREHHLLAILEGYSLQDLPLDLYISRYFRAHKALGSKDRAYIVETLYALIRWKGLIDHLLGSNSPWPQRWQLLASEQFAEAQKDSSLPWHVRLSFPEELFNMILEAYGLEQTIELCLASNKPAPTTVRSNPLKISRDDLLALWQGVYDVALCTKTPYGITFNKKINLFGLPEFKKGFFEVQDSASQQLALLVQPLPGQTVLDYCAGSGGKTLAFAPAMENRGQIFLHDIRPHALQEARKRLKRAGIQNAQIVIANDPKLKKLKKNCDWVLVDAPCSGSGTLRRNPDMKWKIDGALVRRLVSSQRQIFEKALSYLKPGGKIIYATCSLLREENQQQCAHFMSTYNLQLVQEPFQTLPANGMGDGFFGAVLQRSS
jgi:16S rRNA C967 or C1407 C5-methylase (RsmB/RsmF family)